MQLAAVTRSFATIASASAAIGLAGCTCEARDLAREHAGDAAVDCGTVPHGGSSSTAVDDCVLAAFRDSRAFLAEYQQVGRDCAIGHFLAFDGRTLEDLRYETGESYCSNAVTGVRCGDPFEGTAMGGVAPVSCPATTQQETFCD